jgi:hypothetical protein
MYSGEQIRSIPGESCLGGGDFAALTGVYRGAIHQFLRMILNSDS